MKTTGPSLINPNALSVLVIDVQARLAPVIEGGDLMVQQIGLCMDFFKRLDVPCVVTEHCPDRLGATVATLPIEGCLVLQKTHFSAVTGCPVDQLAPRSQVLVVGAEAHVCVLQTVSGLIASGREVFVVDELVRSRHAQHRRLALERMRAMGATLVCLEMAFFECLAHAEHPEFRHMLTLIRNK